MESTKPLSKEFNLKDKEITQAYEFQKVVIEEFKKLDPTENKKEYYTDIDNVTRFLIARDFKVPKALDMWKNWYKWRIDYRADDIKESEIETNLKSGKAFWHGNDKQGCPCLIVKVKRHIPGGSTVEENLRFGVYILEEGVKKMEAQGVSKICVIWDREGFNMKKNFDKSILTVMKQLMGIMQDFYAERLEMVYILKPNWFFRMIMGMMKPFLSEKTKNKIKMVNDSKDLLKYFEPDQLLVEHGGTSKFQYSWPPGSAPFKDDDTDNADEDVDESENPDIKAAMEKA